MKKNRLYLLTLFILLANSLTVNAQVDSSEIDKIEKYKQEEYAIDVELLLSEPKLPVGTQTIIKLGGTSLVVIMDEKINEEKNLEQSRLSKGGKSLEFVEEVILKNIPKAKEHILKNLHSNTILIADKLSSSSYKIRVFKVIYKEEKEM